MRKHNNKEGKARKPYALNQKGGAIASARDKRLRSERRENRVLIKRGYFD